MKGLGTQCQRSMCLQAKSEDSKANREERAKAGKPEAPGNTGISMEV